MGLRITTWNVNGIRNPFQYQPWRDKKTFASMFDILEADIVIFQETKIQRKDLRDDMVLVPGWDCYFSLPKHKKGYSGVVIYTRQSVCAPIRAEEGITGILSPPNSSKSFLDLPKEQQIGGYPTNAQLASSVVDAATLDSEGRCIILEFPAFVLLGVYSPANRDETRDDFRLGFLDVLDARVRNLITLGKRVFLTGDLNISREELDTANAEAAMRKNGFTEAEYASTPARRLFNHLLEGGKVYGERDQGREKPVLWDICRAFHSTRKGMFTCWEQKVNARPGNYGARIDYVLCSLDMKDWFCDANIQEGLMGSDHCPVYAIIQDKIIVDGKECHVHDVMNHTGMFVGGQRQREYSSKDMLPLSGKLIPDFDRRRNIRDMFTRKPSIQQSQSAEFSTIEPKSPTTSMPVEQTSQSPARATDSAGVERIVHQPLPAPEAATTVSPKSSASKKRSRVETSPTKPTKHAKSTSAAATGLPSSRKGQQSLKGFFRPKTITSKDIHIAHHEAEPSGAKLYLNTSNQLLQPVADPAEGRIIKMANEQLPGSILPAATPRIPGLEPSQGPESISLESSLVEIREGTRENQEDVHDPIESKESWSKLFTKPVAPRCEGHNEPCISLLTKKSGMNCGRSFWMCPRPLGPTGAKEKNTQWRCQTFIWCSDWNPGAA